MSEGPALDADQSRVASAPREARQIVIAGPGSGKSEVVGQRCRLLLDDDVYPEEILVISFSNAAVGVVRERTADVMEEGRAIDSATIDSLAARIRRELGETDPTFTAYDISVTKATQLIEKADAPVFPDVRHVIVDEVQDIVGLRARFVLDLLAYGFHEDVGFTLLGDPMQSLYDFQLKGAENWSAERFLDEVRSRFEVEESVLAGEYRTRTDDARAVARARPALSALSEPQRLRHLHNLMAELAPLGHIDDDMAEDLAAWKGTTALLTDTNARAGLVADRLSAHGLPVELAASATDPSLVAWIGRILGHHPSGRISREDFLDLAADLPDAQDLWKTLVRVADSRGGLDLTDLATGLRSRRYPLPLLRTPASAVIASTVHRAKGLEFDNVVLVDPEDWHGGDDGAAARRLFVAMSRARNRLSRCLGTSTRSWRKDPRGNVWLQLPPHRRGCIGLLMEPGHARGLGPVAYALDDTVGLAVAWGEAEETTTVDGHVVPTWTASVEGVEVARTSEDFGVMVDRLSFRGRVPALRGGRVEGLETVVGPPGHTGPGQYGFWVGARISGPITFEWE